MKKLQISSKLSLPLDAITQTFGILAKRGAGKSNAGAVMAEEMYAAGLPFVVVDPVGAWWGLRSSADGKGTGLSVPIFGGYRGDVPLEPQGAQLVADLIVEENLSAVLDVSAFNSEGEKRRFLAAFAERLYLQKGKPGHDSPLHLFLEEADDYIPQRATGDVARCLGAFERIVKRGRARGLGVTMITQRSAALNKDVLTQIETLIVLRTTSPQDRAAIGMWVKYHGQSDEILASLSSLADGEAWVWSPWLDLTERVQINRRTTFDSGATPSLKAKRAVATLADVDLDAITAQMKETIERSKADDPAELRKRIRELEAAAKDSQISQKPQTEPERIEVPVEVHVAHVPDLVIETLSGVTYEADTLLKAGETFGETLVGMATRLKQNVAAAMDVAMKVPSVGKQTERALPAAKGRGAPTPVTPKAADRADTTRSSRTAVADAPAGEPVRSGTITGPQQRVLDALAWLERLGLEGERVRVGFLSGYRRGGRFSDVVSSCRTSGLIDYPRSGVIELTPEGRALATPLDIPATTGSIQAAVMARLNGPQRRVLQPLIDAYPEEVSREELAPASGYQLGGRFADVVSSVKTLGLIGYPRSGFVVALPVLFLEGR